MSGDSLSQEEIDAMLAAGDGGDADSTPETPGDEPDEAEQVEPQDDAGAGAEADGQPVDDVADEPEGGSAGQHSDPTSVIPPERFPDALTADERDTLGEIGNISMANAATTLSTLLGNQVTITTPTVVVTTEPDVVALYDRPAALVRINYTEGLDGANVFVISTRDVSIVADLMMGGPGTPSDEIDELHASAVGEAMNQMMGAAATSMASMFGHRVDISSPDVNVLDMATPEAQIGLSGADDPMVCASFNLQVGDLLSTTLMQLMPLEFAKGLVASLLGASQPEQASGSEPAAPVTTEQAPAPAGGPAMAEAAATTAPVQSDPSVATPPPAPSATPPPSSRVEERPGAVAQPAQFPSLGDGAASGGVSDIGMLLDVPLQVSVELGRTELRIRNVLQLVPGSIIELERLAGEPVDVLVNGRQLARGEVVVIDEEFGIRITEIASQASRLQGIADG